MITNNRIFGCHYDDYHDFSGNYDYDYYDDYVYISDYKQSDYSYHFLRNAK